MKKNIFAGFILMILVLGCGDDSTDAPTPTNLSSGISVGDSTYHLTEDAKIEGTISDGKVLAISAGENQIVASFVAQAQQIKKASSTAGNSLESKLSTAKNKLSNLGNLSTLTEQTYSSPLPFTIGNYTLNTSSQTPMELVGKILKEITAHEGYPTAQTSSIVSSDYRVMIAVVFYNGYYYYLVSALPTDSFTQYGALAETISSGTNMSNNTVVELQGSDSFVGTSSATEADFLFVIDDSGSMSSNQNAVLEAADAFEVAILNSGLNYNIAIIGTGDSIDDNTTDYGRYVATRVLNNIGIIDNNITEFKENIVLGTSASGLETGIYNSETALKPDGVLTAHNFPRADTSLSIIILSDEPSQYRDRAYVEFDVNNNLFINKDYKVYSFVHETRNNQYRPLAESSGGFYADITNLDGYKLIMKEIAKAASGAASSFTLGQTNVKTASIDVIVNGISIVESTDNGWKYNTATNSIAFYGTALPKEAEQIVVNYTYEEVANDSSVGEYTGELTGAFTENLEGTLTLNSFIAQSNSLEFTGSFNATTGTITGTFVNTPTSSTGSFTATVTNAEINGTWSDLQGNSGELSMAQVSN